MCMCMCMLTCRLHVHVSSDMPGDFPNPRVPPCPPPPSTYTLHYSNRDRTRGVGVAALLRPESMPEGFGVWRLLRGLQHGCSASADRDGRHGHRRDEGDDPAVRPQLACGMA